jgi:hypothetical protein
MGESETYIVELTHDELAFLKNIVGGVRGPIRSVGAESPEVHEFFDTLLDKLWTPIEGARSWKSIG